MSTPILQYFAVQSLSVYDEGRSPKIQLWITEIEEQIRVSDCLRRAIFSGWLIAVFEIWERPGT
jgi:hypothetical protein